MKNRSKIAKAFLIFSLLALLASLLTACKPPSPSPPTTLKARLTIGEVEVAAGGTARVKIAVKVLSGPGFTEIQVGPDGALTFDPEVIQIVGVSSSVFSLFVSSFEVDSEAVNSTGELRFTGAVFGGSGIREADIVEIEVKAVGSPGESCELKLIGVDVLNDANGDSITPFEVVNGAVNIHG